MLLYFYLLELEFFDCVMRPSLAQSHRQKNFAPCRDLCRILLAGNPGIPRDALVRAILAGLPFDRVFWQGLVGECLVHGAADIPRFQTAPDTLCCLLAPDHFGQPELPRADYHSIQQVHFGTRDLTFGGGFYRPDHAGLNDAEDVCRLAGYLETIDPTSWTPAGLGRVPECSDDEQRSEELAYARDWWPSLVELYQNARDRDLVVVCEKV